MTSISLRLSRVTVAVLLTGQSACMVGPHAVRVPPADFIQTQAPKQVWITQPDGRTVLVQGPQIISDTIFGWTNGGADEYLIALGDVKRFQARTMSTGRTGLMAGAIVVGLGGTVALIAGSGGDGPQNLGPECLADNPLECQPEDHRVGGGLGVAIHR